MDLEVTHPDVQALADKAEQFVVNWFNARSQGWTVIIVGHPGCGKTHVSKVVWDWARLNALRRWEQTSMRAQSHIPSVTFQKWNRMASADHTTEEGFAWFMRDVDDSSLVVVDDIGTETDRYRTGIPSARLCQLLDHCRNKWLWLTTNKHPSEWSATWDKRVEDRLLAGDVLLMDAPSWRSDRP